ncbi:MAG: hypothetical protein QGF74_01810 [Candidatus Nanoarchaeia archaeon]|jgi:hypothetical protein|nr:hypothetical protein [Candidatus Nanoarchaeia archaeon]|tara:strand:+ start:14973 stop:15173 length:201 start_codon:yes stop_codon:yes gene_type:complete
MKIRYVSMIKITYITTICPLCDYIKLKHFIPIEEKIEMTEILEETCRECEDVLEVLETYDGVIDQI